MNTHKHGFRAFTRLVLLVITMAALLCGCTDQSSSIGSLPLSNTNTNENAVSSSMPLVPDNLDSSSSFNNGEISAFPPFATPTNNINKEDATKYYELLASYVNKPFNTNDDIQNIDLLYFFVQIAEDYAIKAGKTYQFESDASMYRFPEDDLVMLSELLFGFSYDFEKYHDEAYFEGWLLNSYDSSTKSYVIGFGTSYDVGAIAQESVFLQDSSRFSFTGNIDFYKSLGVIERTINATYSFIALQADNLVYYQLKSITVNN